MVVNQLIDSNRFRSSVLSTLPIAFIGRTSTISTCRGTLKLAKCSRAYATTSSGDKRQPYALNDERGTKHFTEMFIRHPHNRYLQHAVHGRYGLFHLARNMNPPTINMSFFRSVIRT